MRAKHSLGLQLVFLLLSALLSGAQTAQSFPALSAWKAAVVAGKRPALMHLYSTDPPPRIAVVGKTTTEISADEDVEFWSALNAQRISIQVSQSDSPQPGVQQIQFEATVHPAPPGRTLYILEAQLWQQQPGGWKLVAVQRTSSFKLEQPLSLDAKIYPPASSAREQIQQAVVQAAKANKRVLVVFGADWCYDCHVLDRALERPDIAPVLRSNFELVQVDVGTGDKNQDLMNEYQVPMSRGIPALAVLDSTGKLLYSQKNGEFERARALGPEDLLAFLNRWKPQAR
jgi:hypothetical protein